MERREVAGFCPLSGGRAADDDEYFEALTASVFACRFSSEVVRARWPAIRAAFAGFSLPTVARWPDDEVDRLLLCPGLIRNRKKILATLRNARDLLARSQQHGSVHAYVEAFRPDLEALVRDLDGWAHYVGAPSLRGFLRCAGITTAWSRAHRNHPAP